MKRTLACTALIAILTAPAVWAVAPEPCEWVNNEPLTITTGPYATNIFWGDTNNAYLLYRIQNPGDYLYRLKARFPNARYMSLESSVYIDSLLGFGIIEGGFTDGDQSLADIDDIKDFEIQPDADSGNPFSDSTTSLGGNNYYTVDLIPDEDFTCPTGDPGDGEEFCKNTFTMQTGSSAFIAYRAVSLNPDGGNPPSFTPFSYTLPDSDIPTIEAYDADGNLVDCPTTLGDTEPEDWIFGDAPTPSFSDVAEFSRLVDDLLSIQRERTTRFMFEPTAIPVEGSSAIPTYMTGVSVVKPGSVMIFKWRKPSYPDTFFGDEPLPSNKDLRFWSLCAIDWETGITMSCMPDFLTAGDPEDDGTVKVAYGPEEYESYFDESWTYLIDNREDIADFLGSFGQFVWFPKWDRVPIIWVYRQVLPSGSYAPRLRRSDYIPEAKVCQDWELRFGRCDFLRSFEFFRFRR